MNGGMGVDLSNDTLVKAVMAEGGAGTLSASAVGFNARREQILAELSLERRVELFQQANRDEILRQIRSVREAFPYGILSVNILVPMNDFDSLVEDIGSSGEVDLLFPAAGLPRGLAKQMEQYPHMRYAPLVSGPRAAQIMMSAADKSGGRPPDAFYVELPQFAGGHLGAKDVEDAMNTEPADPAHLDGPRKFDAEVLIQQIREVARGIPLILAGGIAYGQDIKRAHDLGYDGVSMGTRLLLTQESGMPNHLLEKYYLDSRYRVTKTMTSPAGLPSSIVEGPVLPVLTEDVVREIRSRCVSCIGQKRCQFFRPGGEEHSYCIARRLPASRRGEEGGVLFTGSRLEEMRNDTLYTLDGKPYIPTAQEAMSFVFSGMRGNVE